MSSKPVTALFGFFYVDKYKFAFHDSDSEPEVLGAALVEDIMTLLMSYGSYGMGRLKEKFLSLKSVSKNQIPNEEDTIKLFNFYGGNDLYDDDAPLTFSTLMDGGQGSFEEMIKTGFLLDANDEKGNLPVTNYKYVINFSTMNFDFFVGTTLVKSVPLLDLNISMSFNFFGGCNDKEFQSWFDEDNKKNSTGIMGKKAKDETKEEKDGENKESAVFKVGNTIKDFKTECMKRKIIHPKARNERFRNDD